MKQSDSIHVAVGVILNAKNQVLICKRPAHLHQGGLWEFPGGKVEADEDVTAALQRELYEELSINVSSSRPLITIPHQYPDRNVYLDVHVVTGFTGNAIGNEGQELRWVDLEQLDQFEFPAANRPIINAIRLPDRYLITGRFADVNECERKIRSAAQNGIGLIQLRQKDLMQDEFIELADRLSRIVAPTATKLLLNTSLEIYEQTTAHGIHYTGERLRQCQQRPVAEDKLFSVSTHTYEELLHAVEIGADFAMLSPVLPTESHPGEPAIGWATFKRIVQEIPIPVFALGGMTVELIGDAQTNGAQGIAAISALWNDL